MDFKTKLNSYVDITNTNLDKLLPKEDEYPQTIYKAMRYSVFIGGKRLRPVLALSTCEMLGGNIDEVIPYACAIEMIHTYSLIHDDLPAMDNDDYRRGRPTNHKVFGEDMAILAGDALLNASAEIMTTAILQAPECDKKYISAMNEVLTASGTKGMISGQVVDLESEGKEVDINTLEFTYKNKTGALITAPVRAGAIIGGASEEELKALTEFSQNLGLAFQIKDDILDVIGDESKLGKTIGSDASNNKSTFVSIYGIEKAKEMVNQMSQKAIDSLDIFKERGQFLKELSYYLISRES